MQIYCRVDSVNNRISEIGYREKTYADDFPLPAMPTGFGPWEYDAVLGAVPPTLTQNEKIGNVKFGNLIHAAIIKILWCRTQTPVVAPPVWAMTVLNTANNMIDNVMGLK